MRILKLPSGLFGLMLAVWLFCETRLYAEAIWIEGEHAVRSTMNGHPWYDQVQRNLFSGGDFVSNFHKTQAGEAEYTLNVQNGGEYQVWVRANPFESLLEMQIGDGNWQSVVTRTSLDSTNVAEADALDIRFLGWIDAGQVTLQKGEQKIRFRMHSANSHHGYLDCFVVTNQPFSPQGIRKPGEPIAVTDGWFPFSPTDRRFGEDNAIDLRHLNELNAGDGGFIAVDGDHFVHRDNGRTIRFWGVNGPPRQLETPDEFQQHGRLMAKYGVNLIRIHSSFYDKNGQIDSAEVMKRIEMVHAFKQAGIYSHLSIYFPLWLEPDVNNQWLSGYDGKSHPFAALYFNQDFQRQYQAWWKAILLTPHPATGKRLVDEPALAFVEIQNEDSCFFWTFKPEEFPPALRKEIELRFGSWAAKKYGSVKAARSKWGWWQKHENDDVAAGRLGIRPLWNVFNDKKLRDQDTAAFLVDVQREFYQQMYDFLREIGFQGAITCSNWVTASPEVLGPLEKYSYTVGDFMDRHGYFGCLHKGENAAWSVRNGHTFRNRSALRFEAEDGDGLSFVHPAVDITYANKPSMISETTFNRPNRYRSEAPLFFASYGSLQGTDAFCLFALDGAGFSVKPNYHMQPWTLMSPAHVGQFPVAALLYRKGFIRETNSLVQIRLNVNDLTQLKGTPLPQGASFDELRLKDVPKGQVIRPGDVVDPLVHFVGRTDVAFVKQNGTNKMVRLDDRIDRKAKRVSSEHGQLVLDYGKGVLYLNAPHVQGFSGALQDVGEFAANDFSFSSPMELGHVVIVSLDDQPLSVSKRMLIQVMSEEKTTDFETKQNGNGQEIVNIGRDPWLVKELAGQVTVRRGNANQWSVTLLDEAGYPVRVQKLSEDSQIKLEPTTIYYLLDAGK